MRYVALKDGQTTHSTDVALFALGTVLLAGLFDVLFGEPPTPVHPVAWIGKLISFFERCRPVRHLARNWPGAC